MSTDHLPSPTQDASGASSRVAIITLGCGRNEVDSDQLAGVFHREGSQVVDDPADADAVVINTCTFIAPAKQESIDTVLAACQLKEDGRTRAVLVVGCMAQRYPHELADAIPEADAVVGFDGYANLPTIVDDALGGRLKERVIGVGAAHPGSRPTVADARTEAPPSTRLSLPVLIEPTTAAPVQPEQDELDRIPASGPRFPVRAHDGRPWAYLKIASGCDRVCTFCAIPSFRGRFRSRPLDEILAEAGWLADNGARELVLVSENTTSWGKDLPGGRAAQPTLLRELAQIDGIERLRLMYLQPAELTDDLIEAIATQPKVASYFDLSLQHVSGPVVARMARSGDHERFGGLIQHIRGLDPQAVFRSNFILGFPGETEADVDRLADFLVTHRLDWVGLFPFSREDGTASDSFPDQVPEQLVRERQRRISELQEQLADEATRAFVGRDLDVTVQDHRFEAGEPVTIGRSYREAPDTDGEIYLVLADTSSRSSQPADLPVGRTVTARVVDSVGVDLIAEVSPATAGSPS